MLVLQVNFLYVKLFAQLPSNGFTPPSALVTQASPPWPHCSQGGIGDQDREQSISSGSGWISSAASNSDLATVSDHSGFLHQPLKVTVWIKGYTVIQNIVGRFSKLPSATQVADILFLWLFRYYGVPEDIGLQVRV